MNRTNQTASKTVTTSALYSDELCFMFFLSLLYTPHFISFLVFLHILWRLTNACPASKGIKTTHLLHLGLPVAVAFVETDGKQ